MSSRSFGASDDKEGPNVQSIRGQKQGSGTGSASRLLRVGLLCDLPEQRTMWAAQLRTLSGMELVDPTEGRTDVMLCVAGSVWALVAQLDSTARRPQRVVVLDLAAAIGPRVAALHGARGYITPAYPPERLLSCLQRAAWARVPDAPAPFDGAFLYTWGRGPLTEAQRSLLRCAALGLTQAQMAKSLGRSPATIQRWEQKLKDLLDMEDHQHLAAAAVELGLYRLWPTPERES